MGVHHPLAHVVVRTILNSLGGCSVIFQFFIFLINWFDMSSAQSKRDPFLDPGEKPLPKEEVEFILIGAGACLFSFQDNINL